MDADALSRENAHLKARLTEVEAALAEVQEANRRLGECRKFRVRAGIVGIKEIPHAPTQACPHP
jgi:hypothetical protein